MSWVPSGSEVFSPPKAVACTANAIAWHAEHTPDAIAVFDNERAVTWRALACDLGGSVARAADLGRRGSLIGVETGLGLYRNLLAFLACEVIGATSTPFRQSDLCNDPVLDRCDARLFDGTPPPQAYSPRLWDQPPPDGIARISRTSGSTGATKAVPTTFATLQRILVQRIAHLPDAIRPAPRLLCAYNLGIRSIYIRVCATLLAGGTVFRTPPERTAAAFVDGWYRTDDFGVMPAPGTLVVLGRADGMLNIGGIKLPVAPLEDQIRTIQMVTDAVVFSDGDDLVVAVECPHGPPQGMHIAVRSIVSRYVRAVQVTPMPAFPRAETGKVRRNEVIASHQQRRPSLSSTPHNQPQSHRSPRTRRAE